MDSGFWYNIVDRWEHRAKIKFFANCNSKLKQFFVDEIATTGTKHMHIFIYSKSPIRFSTLKNRFPVAHIDKANGSVMENRDYLRKEGNLFDK